MTDNLYDLLLERLDGIPYNGYFMCLCPYPHNGYYETHPSMMVHEDNFFCKTCGKRGGLKSLVVAVNRDIARIRPSRKLVSNILPKWRKWENNYGDLQGIADHAHQSLRRFSQFRWYFEKRKIDQFIEQGYFGYLDNWCLFPVFDQDGKIIDIVVRAGKGKSTTRYVLHPDQDRESPYLYVPNWKRVLESNIVYVVYGIVDSWSLEDVSLPCITGTSGKSLNYELLKKLDKQFIIIPDKYEDKEAYNLANKLSWRGDVKVLPYPSKCKDIDNIRTEFGNDVLLSMIGEFAPNISSEGD